MRNRPQLGKLLPIRLSVPIPSFARLDARGMSRGGLGSKVYRDSPRVVRQPCLASRTCGRGRPRHYRKRALKQDQSNDALHGVRRKRWE